MMSRWVAQSIKKAATTQAELARDLSRTLNRTIDRAAVNKMITGGRKVTADEMLAISRLTGNPLPSKYLSVVPVVGLVGASPDGDINFYHSSGVLGRVTMPPWGSVKTVALEVRGSSMRGMADNGWYVYYERREEVIDLSLLGQLCVVGLEDGRTLIKIPHQGSQANLFHLESVNAPLLKDQWVIWISQVTACVPPNIARLLPED